MVVVGSTASTEHVEVWQLASQLHRPTKPAFRIRNADLERSLVG